MDVSSERRESDEVNLQGDHLLLPADEEGGTSSPQHIIDSDDITQKLRDLSALVPGSNEIDEFTVVSKTIQHVNELHEHLSSLSGVVEAALEDTASSRRTGEIGLSDDRLADIDARILDKEVLVRIFCRDSNDLLIHILSHLDNLQLSVMWEDFKRIGPSHAAITIVAQMEEGFNMTVKELIVSLQVKISQSL